MNGYMSSTNPAYSKITPSDTDLTELEKLGELRWSVDDIATFFGWDASALEGEMRDPVSEVRKAILKGELKATFEMESKLLADAKSGNQTSIKLFSEMVRERSFKLTKLDLFGGADDPSLFEAVEQLLSSGKSGRFDSDEQLYIQALQMIYSFQLRFGDRKTLQLLQKEPFALTFPKAKEMLAEAIELFNGGRRNTRQAMRYHMAESYDTLYHAILDTAKTPQDFALAAGILDKRAKLLQLDQPEPETVAPENYPRKFIVSSLAPESIGLPTVSRDALGAQIDALELPAAEADRLKREAGIKDFDIIKTLDDAIEEEN